jgi:hypothetical protein
MNIRKFYDAEPEAANQGGGEPESIASLMAKQGKMSHENNPVVPGISPKSEPKSETKTQEPIPVETTKESIESRVEPEAQKIAKEEPQANQWQEVLRQQKPEAILKELGFNEDAVGLLSELKEVDPKMVKFLSTWKTNGDGIKDYLKEMTTDYSQMPSEDVMRHQLREEYPKATEKQLDVLFRKEIVEKYNLDSMDEDLVEEGRLLLDAKTEMYRDKLVQKQQEYLLPQHTQKTDESEERAQQEFENYKNNLLGSQLTQDMMQSKRLSIGEGDEKFNYPLTDPNSVVNNLFDSNAWSNKLFEVQKDANGNEQFIPNIEKQLLISAILEDHKGFLREIAKHYKSLGGKATIDSLDNPSPIGGSAPSKPASDPKSPAEWMARNGRLA